MPERSFLGLPGSFAAHRTYITIPGPSQWVFCQRHGTLEIFQLQEMQVQGGKQAEVKVRYQQKKKGPSLLTSIPDKHGKNSKN